MNEIQNYTLDILAHKNIPVANIRVAPGLGGSIVTLVRFPNQYGVSVNQRDGELEIAVVYWTSSADDMDDWEWADNDDPDSSEYRNQRFQTVVDLAETINTICYLPDLR